MSNREDDFSFGPISQESVDETLAILQRRQSQRQAAPVEAAPNSISGQKQASLGEAVAAKRVALGGVFPAIQQDLAAGMNPRLVEYRYGRRAMDEYRHQREVAASRSALLQSDQRTAGEVAQDTGLGLAIGGTNLTAGTAVAAADMAGRTAEMIPQTAVAARMGSLLARRLGLPTGGDLVDTASEGLSDATTGMRNARSDWSQEVSAHVAELNAAGAAASRAQYEEDLAEGRNALLAGARRVGRDAVRAGSNVLDHTTELSNLVTEQVPSLATGLAGKGLTSARGIREGARALAQEEGKDLAKMSIKERGAYMARAQAQQERNNLVGIVAGTEAGGAYGEASAEVWQTPFAELIANNPEAQEAYRQFVVHQIEREVDPVEAAERAEDAIRGQLASDRGIISAGISGTVAAGVAGLGAGFVLDPMGRRAVAGASRTSARAAAPAASSITEASLRQVGQNVRDVGGEIVEEGVQGGAASLGGNVAQALTGDENVDFLEGMGDEIGVGAVAAGTLSGGMRAPVTATAMAQAAVSGTMDAIRLRGERSQAKLDEVAIKNAEAVAQQQFTAAASAQETLRNMPDAPVVDLAVPSDAVVPEGLAEAPAADMAPDRLTAQAKAMTELAALGANPEADPRRMTQLMVFVAGNARAVQNQITNVLQPALDAATDPERQQKLADTIATLAVFTEGEQVQAIKQQLAQLPQDQVDAMFNQLPEDISEQTELAPQVQELLGFVNEVALHSPEKISVEQAERVLAARSFLKPEQRSRMEAVRDLAKSRIPYEEVLAIANKVGKKKSASLVSEQVANTGFSEEGSKLKSTSQHFSDISQAMDEGRKDDARKQFLRLTRWAQHAQQRAQGAQEESLRKLEASDDSFTPINARVVNEQGKLTNDRFKVNPFQISSAATVDLMGAEANVIAETVEALSRAYPDLGEVSLPRVDRVDLYKLGTGLNPGQRAAANRLSRGVADAQARGVNVQAILGEDGRVQLQDAGPMHPNQKNVSVLRADGKPMTAVQLENLLTGMDVRSLVQPQAAPAATAAPVTEPEPTPTPAPAAVEPAAEPVAEVEPAVEPVVEPEAEPEPVETPEPAEVEEESQPAAPEAPAVEIEPAAQAEQAEQAAPTRTLAERFMGVLEQAGKIAANATPAQVRTQMNRLLNAFQPAERRPGLSDRVPGGIDGLLDAIDNNRLADVLPARYRHLATEENAENLRAILEGPLTQIANRLDDRANELLDRVKSATGKHAGMTVRQIIESGDTQLWSFPEYQFLHAIQFNGDGTAHFIPEVLDAMSLAALNWVMENSTRPVKPKWEKLWSMWPKGMPSNLHQAYRTSHFLDDGPRSIGRDIQNILGLQADNLAPGNHAQDLMNTLALHSIQALADTDFLTLDAIEVPGQFTDSGEKVTLHFARFEPTQRWDQAGVAVPPRGLMAAVVNPYDAPMPFVGAIPEAATAKGKGTNQHLSSEQQEVEKRHNEQAFYLNTDLLDALDRIGWDAFKQVRGHDTLNLNDRNRVDRAGVEGLNQSIDYQDERFADLRAELEAYVAAHGGEITEVPVRWLHRTLGTNGRVMAQGTSPQTDKLFRELLTQKAHAITKGDIDAENRLYAAAAQGLGLAKLEHAGIEGAAAAMRDALAKPVTQAALAYLQGGTGDFQALVPHLKSLAGIKVEDTKSIHALLTLAQYAQAEEGKPFSYRLTAEIDGVNNGPHNAHLQFFSGYLTEEDLRQMAQGGVYLGQGRPETLADQKGKNLGDRYTDVAEGTLRRMRERVGWVPAEFKQTYVGAKHFLEKAKLASIDEETRTIRDMTRAFGKSVLVPVGYMSGQKAVARKLAGQFEEVLYAEITAAVRENRPVDARLVREFNRMINKKLIVKSEELLSEPGGAITIPTDRAELIDYMLPHWASELLANNIQHTLGEDAFLAADENLSKAREVLGEVVDLSQMMSAISDALFDRAYEARRQELVAAGELSQYDALPEQEARKVLASLDSLLPNVALAHTDSESSAEGLSAVVRDKGKVFEIASTRNLKFGKTTDRRAVRMPDSGLSLNTTRTGIGEPGVRMAPLLTIGSGDVTMVHLLKLRNDLMEFLQIWDGLDVHPEQMGKLGEAANQAAFESWNHTALNSVADTISRADPDLINRIDDEVAEQVMRTLLLDWQYDALFKKSKKNPTPTTPKAELVSRWEGMLERLPKMAAYREDMWTAMKELGVSVDQMSGGGVPFVHPGSGESMTPEQIVAAVNARVDELQANRSPATARNRDHGSNKLLTELLPGKQVRRYTKSEVVELLRRPGLLDSKVDQFVLKTITPLLPESLVVTMGTRAAIGEIVARRPDAKHLQEIGFAGLYLSKSKQILVQDFSPRTILHELVHAATMGMISDFYSGNDSKLGPSQKAALNTLEKMAFEFLKLEPGHKDHHARRRMEHLQRVMRELYAKADAERKTGTEAGRREALQLEGDALSEFLAYSLSEKKLQLELSSRTVPEILRNLSQKLVNLVRALLRLPANKAMDDWLSQMLGNVQLLTLGMNGAYESPAMDMDGRTMMSVAEAEMRAAQQELHADTERLTDLSKEFSTLLDLVPTEGAAILTRKQMEHAGRLATADMMNQGFNFNPIQRTVYQQIQMVFASGLLLDPGLLRGLNAMYEHVMPQLTARDMMDDPDSSSEQDLLEGERRLLALQGHGTVRKDAQGRANHLANFVALGMVDPSLRAALQRLSPPAAQRAQGDVDAVLHDLARQAIDLGASLQLGTLKAPNQQVALDTLVGALKTQQQRMVRREAALAEKSLVDKGEAWLKDQMQNVGTRVDAAAQALRQQDPSSSWRQLTAGVLDALAANTSELRAEAWAESMTSMLNAGTGGKPFREIAQELIGTVKSAYPVTKLLNISKQRVSTMRQRLREESPKQIKSWFKTPLDKKTWQRLHTSVAKVDLAAVWGMPKTQLKQLLSDPDALAKEIAAQAEQLQGVMTRPLLDGAEHLATWMVHERNDAPGMLYRNAHDLARQYEQSYTSVATKHAAHNEPILDRLVTLKALQKLSPAYRSELVSLMDAEPEAMDRLVNTVAALTEIERRKGEGGPLNQWKGYAPKSMDPRKQVRLASPEQAKELLKTGWTRLDSYRGDAQDKTPGLAYYVSTAAGEVTYNQGALQMVVDTAGGALSSGVSLSNVTGLVIDNPAAVARITAAKRRGLSKPGDQNLLPVFRWNAEDEVMEVIAYERTLKADLVQAHTKGDNDLAVGIGIWMGRQAEEAQAKEFNQSFVEELAQIYEREKLAKENEYIALNLSTDPIDQSTWAAIPPQTQRLLLRRFDGKVMVRKDMRNNAFGYRGASVRDVFSGYSGLPENVRKSLETTAMGLLGPNAYKYLSIAEDSLAGLVGSAKDIIVVRSGVVAYVNILANQVQLLSQGIPFTELPRQFKIAKQIETYLRNEHRLARIHTDLRAITDGSQRAKLQAEIQRLEDENRRLDIYDLVQAGELPTIAEGLSETDEYTLVGDGIKWLEQHTERLPKGMKDVARYATISRDTALYQGMNRLIQFGDLMAKQLTYEKQLRDGKSKEDALRYVQDNFVNYNILPGRTRTYLEQMGLLWFWNYKLRIQKIFFRAVRENPLRALTMFGLGDVGGIDTLLSSQAFNTNISYSIGYEQLQRAPEMLMWHQVMD